MVPGDASSPGYYTLIPDGGVVLGSSACWRLALGVGIEVEFKVRWCMPSVRCTQSLTQS